MDATRSRALLHGEVAAAMDAPQFPPSHWTASSCQVPPSPLTNQQLDSIVGLWERKADRGLQCRALLQAVQLDFGLPTAFAAVDTWQTEVKATPLILSTVPYRCIQARHPATRKRCLIASQVGTMGFFTGGTLAR